MNHRIVELMERGTKSAAPLRPSLSDYVEIDRLIQTTYRGSRALYIPTSDPDLHLKLSNRLGMWVFQNRNPGYPDQEVVLGFWPAWSPERALAEVRRITLAAEAKASVPPPPLPLSDLVAWYEQEKLSKLRSGKTARRSLRHGLKGMLDQNARTLAPEALSAALTSIAAASPTHANRCKSYIHGLFRWAIRHGLLTNDPSAALPTFAPEGRHRRNLPLEELAEVWHAAEVLDHPGRFAVRLLILLPLSRAELTNLDTGKLDRRHDGIVWMRKNPAAKGVLPAVTAWRLPPLAADLITAALERDPTATWLLTETGLSPGVNWAGCKRRIVDEINARRAIEGRRRQVRWHLDDLHGSFEAIAINTLRADPGVVARCQDHLHRFRSQAALEDALSQAGTDRACEVLWHWNQLVWAATASSDA